MNEALAFYGTKTVPAFPLGQPVDGLPRYGMTPEQACLYRWLVKHKPHDGPFEINFRAIAPLFLVSAHSLIHDRVMNLIERGWISPHGNGKRLTGRYRFVHPIKQFRMPRHA